MNKICSHERPWMSALAAALCLLSLAIPLATMSPVSAQEAKNEIGRAHV